MICGLGDAVAAAIKSLAVASRYRRVGSNWLGGIERADRHMTCHPGKDGI